MTSVICVTVICNHRKPVGAQSGVPLNHGMKRQIMSNNLPSLLFVDAMVGATAYAQPLGEASVPVPPTAASEQIRRAQVDIYCGHDGQALTAIREARHTLQSSATSMVADTLSALDEAAWFIRHHDFHQAERALEDALDNMRLQNGKLRAS